MSNPNKRKGDHFERALLEHARERGIRVHRLHDGGTSDEGDLIYYGQVVGQAKNTKAIDLAKLKEAEAQAERAGASAHVLIHKRRNHPIGKAYVVMTYDQFLDGLKVMHG